MADDLQEIRRLLAELTQRVYRLEQRAGIESRPQDARSDVAPVAPAQGAPVVRTPPPPLVPLPPPPLSAAAEDVESESLESKIGSQWFNRIGIVAVLVGVSYFLKYAFENNWIGPGGRIAIGLLAGIAVVVWSERFRSHGHLVFSWSLKAVGIGTLYLSLWAGFQMYHLFSPAAAFVAMIAVTAATATLAITQDAQVLAAFALIGGFVTPLLISTGENHEVALFSYVALLDVAVVVLLSFRPWLRLLIGAYLGTQILYVGWYSEFYTRAQLGTTLAFATLLFAVFAVAPLTAIRPSGAAFRRWAAITMVLVPLLNAAVYFLELYEMLNRVSQTALAWSAVGLAALYLVLSRIVQKRADDEESTRLLNLLYVALAVGFLTTAIPLKLDLHWITIGWFAEAAVLMWISYRVPSVFVRLLATLALVLGIARLLVWDNFHPEHLVANARFLTYAIAIATLAWSVYLARGIAAESGPMAEIHRRAAAVGIIAINTLAVLALTFEVHDYFERELAALGRTHLYDRTLWSRQRQFYIARDFAYSAVLMVYGAVLMWAGFWKRSAFLRWQALVLLAITVVKVFTYDVSQLQQGYRVLSFIALGVLLLAVSFIYQRDWLHLSPRRNPPDSAKGSSAPA